MNAEVPLSSIGSSVEYIALESSPESYFSVRRQISLSENYILVADKQLNRVLLFNRDGKFLRQIGKSGKGPGEFPKIMELA